MYPIAWFETDEIKVQIGKKQRHRSISIKGDTRRAKAQ